jgi:hypothetical protein
MMPRMQAEESMLAATRVALGGGSLKKDDAARLRRAWEQAASGGRAPRAIKASLADLQALGIVVRKVKRA